jgi:hypothetical protein
VPLTQVLGRSVLSHDEAVLLVLKSLGLVERQVRANGGRPSLLLEDTQRSFASAAGRIHGERDAMSVGPVPDVRNGTTPPQSTSDQWISSTEVADVLGVTDRHARRLAATLDARRLHGAWRFHRGTVETYLTASLDHRRTAA